MMCWTGVPRWESNPGPFPQCFLEPGRRTTPHPPGKILRLRQRQERSPGTIPGIFGFLEESILSEICGIFELGSIKLPGFLGKVFLMLTPFCRKARGFGKFSGNFRRIGEWGENQRSISCFALGVARAYVVFGIQKRY